MPNLAEPCKPCIFAMFGIKYYFLTYMPNIAHLQCLRSMCAQTHSNFPGSQSTASAVARPASLLPVKTTENVAIAICKQRIRSAVWKSCENMNN